MNSRQPTCAHFVTPVGLNICRCDEHRATLSGPRLFYIDGIRHSAVVVAVNEEEAVKLAISASSLQEGDARVLFGGVDEWESPKATELKLPRGYELFETKD